MRSIVVKETEGEGYQDRIERMKRRNRGRQTFPLAVPTPPKTLGEIFGKGKARSMQRGAAAWADADRRKLGDDY